MKIALLSDLHLSVQPLELPQTDADLVVLAGDLQRPEQGMAWARQFGASRRLPSRTGSRRQRLVGR